MSRLLTLLLAACAPTEIAPPSRAPDDVPGDAGETITEHRVPRPVPVDVLLVVDGTGSMREELGVLAAGLDALVGHLDTRGADWRVVLVSAVPGGDDFGRPVRLGGARWLHPASPDPDRALAAGLGRLTEDVRAGHADGFGATNRALSRAGRDGWRRADAALRVVVGTDRDHRSEPPPWDLIDRLLTLHDATFSLILGVDAPRYDRVVDVTGGVAVDWDEVGLGRLGAHLAEVPDVVVLREPARPGTVEAWVVDGGVEVDGVDLDRADDDPCEACFGFRYDPAANRVVIEPPVRAGAEVWVQYEPAAP